MSLILDALKKSEEKRQLGQAPTLGSSIMPVRKRRSVLPFLLIAIVLITLVGVVWRNKLKHSHRSRTPVATVAQQPAPGGPPPATTAPPFASTPNLNRAATTNASVAPPATPTAATIATVDRPPGSAKNASQPAAVFGGRRPPSPPVTPAMPAAVVPPPAAAAPPPAPAAANTASASVAAANPPVATKPPAAAATPEVNKVQAYYELPFPVRKDLPAIKISMHVYAVDPAQRFVVVNNVHQGEGDSIEGGVTVREIRPTDIVLEFQGKIFSVPRTGI